MNKDLAGELITIIVEPKILAPYLASHSNLPAQVSMGEGNYLHYLNETTPYFDKLDSMLKVGHDRPSIPEHPEISVNVREANVREAIEQIYNGTKVPKQVSDDAANKSEKILGWEK